MKIFTDLKIFTEQRLSFTSTLYVSYKNKMIPKKKGDDMPKC